MIFLAFAVLWLVSFAVFVWPFCLMAKRSGHHELPEAA
jgi:hypothetical protein